MEDEPFDELIRLAQAGDEEAMERLLAEVRPFLARLARRLDDPSRASRSAFDLVQEAELHAWRRIGQFEGGGSERETTIRFRAWLAKILRRLALDLERERGTQKRRAPGRVVLPIGVPRRGARGDGSGVGAGIDPQATTSTPSARARGGERAARVREAIAALPREEDRKIIELVFFEGLSLRETSERLGLSYHRVKERHRAAMGKLGRVLGDL